MWKDKNISLSSKLKLLHALVLSIFPYACEKWTPPAELQRKIQTVDKSCFRRILGISYTENATNEKVHATKHVKHYKELLATVKKRKLWWYGQVTIDSWLSKTIQVTVQGERRRGRQRKKWTDNIAEWTGKSFATTQALTRDCQRWRQLVQHFRVQCPQYPRKGREIRNCSHNRGLLWTVFCCVTPYIPFSLDMHKVTATSAASFWTGGEFSQLGPSVFHSFI